MRPQPQVCQNFLHDVGLVNKGNDAHGAPTSGTQQGIGLIHFLNQLGPALLEDRGARRWGNLHLLFPRIALFSFRDGSLPRLIEFE